MAFPGHSAASQYVKDWQTYRPQSTPYEFGWGYGADLGGLSHQPDAEHGDGKLTYPFKSIDGKVTFERQKTGERTFDYTKDGVAHYGLYADWFADLAAHRRPEARQGHVAAPRPTWRCGSAPTASRRRPVTRRPERWPRAVPAA